MPSSEAELTWTTWEELLLAFAVKRHGVEDWDSVAVEMQARSSLSLLFTSQACKSKYDDLKRRFTENETDDVDSSIPWLEELRKLRVSELKQEVHRYDLSIQSLQLKVKSLEEERERNLKEDGKDDVGEPDLGKNPEEERSENDKNAAARSPEERLPELAVGDASDKENRSFNESSSTANRLTEAEPVGTSGTEPEPDPVPSDSKPASEDSYNDSSNTAAAAAKASRRKKGGELAGVRDSAEEESKDGLKENSDVQSSVSLTRKRRREEEVSGGSKPVVAGREGVKSEPLVGLLDIIRSHKHGSVFGRRLESQIQKEEYKNMIRTHMDLETIRTGLENGSYSSCTTKFYRDLLLLFTNAVVFFPKASIESVTACELRDLVLEEVKKNKSTQRSHSSPDPAPAPPNPTSPEIKPDPLKTESLLEKHKSSSPILVCRKRSSISAKTSNMKPTEGKPNLNPNAPAKNSSSSKEDETPKTNERPTTGARSTRSNKGGQTITSPPDSKTKSSADKAGSVKPNDKKKNEVVTAGKKQGAADFLKRIKRNSPLKSGGGEGNSGGGKRENRKRESGRKEAPPVVKPGGNGKRKKEESSPSKQRGGGRTLRKGPPEGGGRKRGREGGGGAAGSKQTMKRSRR